MSYFESLLAKRSRGVRDMLQKSLIFSKQKDSFKSTNPGTA